MRIGVPKEIYPGEQRVALSPQTAQRLIETGFEVAVEHGAGVAADFTDDQYAAAGCTLIPEPQSVWSESGLVVKVRAPQLHPDRNVHESEWLQAGSMLIGFLWPAQHEELVHQLAARGVTALAMDQVPRITRAQQMDALSSMANIAGYRAVVEAAEQFGRFFTGQVTAAGKVPPARVLVIGAGVAGLAAIGAARGLGAIVKAFDTRPEVEEQVQSMGAEFVSLEFEEQGTGEGGYARAMSEAFMEAERALFEKLAAETDIMISTALIPGKPAPYLITETAVRTMANGSVIVDLAAEQGGNCPLTEPDRVVVRHGVKLIGYTDLPSRMASVSSSLYGNNVFHLIEEMQQGPGEIVIDESNDVIRGCLVVNEGKLRWPPPKISDPSPPASAKPSTQRAPAGVAPSHSPRKGARGPAKFNPLPIALAGAALLLAGWVGEGDFLSHLTVFVLACFVGWQVIWNVTAALHTPLMSVTNAISGIIIVGGMLQIGGPLTSPAAVLGVIAIGVATINIAGGFLVTHRMLRMFRRE